MITYITFSADTLEDAQRIISAVVATGYKPAQMNYQLPTPAPVVGPVNPFPSNPFGGIPPLNEVVKTTPIFDGQEMPKVPTGEPDVSLTTQTQSPTEKSVGPVEDTLRAQTNVTPGMSMITKISPKTIDAIFEYLDKGVQPPAAFKEHLKLLWSRGKVRFDGTEFYR